MTWWAGPLDDAVLQGYTDNSPFSVPRLWPDVFGARGVVPIGMAVLALAIGVTAGLRRTPHRRGHGRHAGDDRRGPDPDAGVRCRRT